MEDFAPTCCTVPASKQPTENIFCMDCVHPSSGVPETWRIHLLVCGGQTPYQEVTRDLFVTATRPKSSEKLEYWYSSNWTLVCFIWGMKATLCDFGIISKLLLNLFADHWNRPGSNLYKQSMQLCKIISKGHLKLWMWHCMFVCFSVLYSVWLFISRSTS